MRIYSFGHFSSILENCTCIENLGNSIYGIKQLKISKNGDILCAVFENDSNLKTEKDEVILRKL